MNPAQTPPPANRVASAFEQPDWYISGFAANIRVRSETVQAYTADRTFGHVLDIGCGDGSLSLPFLERGAKVTFLDLSGAMLERVKSRIPPNLLSQATFVQGDFSEIDLGTAVFDLVLYVGVLAYVPDVAAIAARIRKVVRPGGLLMVECTDAGHLFAQINFTYRDLTSLFRPRPCPTFRHRAAEVIAAFQSSGFVLRRGFRYSYTLPVLSRVIGQSKRYALMRRIYGTAEASRRQALGSELLMLFDQK